MTDTFDPLAPFRPDSQVVVLTGASSGLGERFARILDAGLIGLTRELALQWARHGIRVNALCPGMFPTEMTDGVHGNDEVKAMFEAAIPIRRLGRTDELDGAFAMLAPGTSSYMTGQTLVFDGGVAC